MPDSQDPLYVFFSAFGMSSFAGLAALLRSGVRPKPLEIASATMNSGLLGLSLALLWYNQFRDNIYVLVGVCVLAGLGGATIVELVLQALRAGGLTVNLGSKDAPSRIGIHDIDDNPR